MVVAAAVSSELAWTSYSNITPTSSATRESSTCASSLYCIRKRPKMLRASVLELVKENGVVTWDTRACGLDLTLPYPYSLCIVFVHAVDVHAVRCMLQPVACARADRRCCCRAQSLNNPAKLQQLLQQHPALMSALQGHLGK